MHRSASSLLGEKMPNEPEFEENSLSEEAEEAQGAQARPAICVSSILILSTRLCVGPRAKLGG